MHIKISELRCEDRSSMGYTHSEWMWMRQNVVWNVSTKGGLDIFPSNSKYLLYRLCLQSIVALK